MANWVWFMCFSLYKFYEQEIGCVDLDYVDNRDTRGNSKIDFICLCEYINCNLLFVDIESGL